MKTLEINGVTFELTEPRKTVELIYKKGFGSSFDIYKWYERPSTYKISIWEDWLKWALNSNGVFSFNICSANTFMFSIEGCYRSESGDWYNLFITRDHNRAIKVNS